MMFASFRAAVATVTVLALGLPALGRENPYDVLGKVLTPLLGILAEKPRGDRAVSLRLRVEEAGGLESEVVGTQVDLALESPDRLRMSGPLFGQRITLCRRGQTVWVYPGSTLKALLENEEVASNLPAPNREFKMQPFKLPLPAKQLVFLPALLRVRDVGDETIAGKRCQGIDAKLMPELANSLKIGDWSATIWVDEKVRPMRLAVMRGETRLVILFEKMAYAKTLPPETWAPTVAESGDVLIVPPARYDQLLRAMMGER